MAISKTGRQIEKGDWLYDTTGVYEVISVDAGAGNLTYLKEIIFAEDDSDNYGYGDERWLTRREVAHMDVF